jgi:hypothetical protein
MTLWCKHQNLPRDSVLFFSAGPLDSDATAAGHGWSPGELVVLDALLATDEAAQVTWWSPVLGPRFGALFWGMEMMWKAEKYRKILGK